MRPTIGLVPDPIKTCKLVKGLQMWNRTTCNVSRTPKSSLFSSFIDCNMFLLKKVLVIYNSGSLHRIDASLRRLTRWTFPGVFLNQRKKVPGEIKTVGGDWNQQQHQLRVPGGQTQTQARDWWLRGHDGSISPDRTVSSRPEMKIVAHAELPLHH